VLPTLDVYGNGLVSRFSVDSLTASSEEGKHDQFSAYIALGAPVYGMQGWPCTLTWGSGAATQSMIGYVDTVSEMTGDDALSGWAVIGLGATSKMRSGTARSFRRSTPFLIASNIVLPHRMGVMVDQYIYPLDAFMQTSESDWAALGKLADSIGMSLIADGTTAMLVDVRRAIGRAALRPIKHIREPDSFIKLDTPSPVGFDTFEFTGIDRMGSSFTVRGGPEGGVKRHAGENFSSLEEARNAARRWEDRQRFMKRAMATFSGQVAVKAGDVLMVEGGTWYVAGVRHTVALGSQKQTVQIELHQTEEKRPSSAYVPSPPTSVQRNGAWVSSQSYAVAL